MAAETTGASALPPQPDQHHPDASDVHVDLGKKVEEFRVYKRGDSEAASDWDKGVVEHYRQMRLNHTLAFSRRMRAKWATFNRAKMSVREALALADTFVDRSDPDTSFPNSAHMLQAAEAARAQGKPEWFQLVALVHDIGKIMYKWSSWEDGQGGKATDPQWALGGDTFVVGCRIPDCCVYPEFNGLNPDMADPVYSTEHGIYGLEGGTKPPASPPGIMALELAFGHDEYAYMWAVHNKVQLPLEGLAMLKLHSLYPWHRGGAYKALMAPGDEELLRAVTDFNTFDLYTKASAVPDIDAVWPHYQGIIDRLCGPGPLDW